MAIPKNIILVGFMATGKSHVGRILSEKSGWPLVDADDEIVRRAGRSVHRIFADDGEAAFRDLERLVIADLCAGSQRIISAGGGAFVDADNRRLMLASGLVVGLSATPETIYSRVEAAGSDTGPVRPLLAGSNSEDPSGDPSGEQSGEQSGEHSRDDQIGRIESLLAQRADAYAQAHYTVKTDALTPQQVAERILEMCGLKGISGG